MALNFILVSCAKNNILSWGCPAMKTVRTFSKRMRCSHCDCVCEVRRDSQGVRCGGFKITVPALRRQRQGELLQVQNQPWL